MNKNSIEQLLAQVKSSRIALLRDDVQPAERAILLAPARDITADEVNRLINLTGGIIFAALSPERAEAFLLSPMRRPQVMTSSSGLPTNELNICISVEAREGVTTGISAADRAVTLGILGAPEPNPRKLVQPGHIFPVGTKAGGVLVRNALPEGAVDIVSIAGFTPAAAYLDVLDSSGNFVSGADLDRFAAANSIPQIRLSELTRYRLAVEKVVYRVAEAKLPTKLAGELRSCIYKSILHEGEHLALIKGEIDPNVPVLTRVQPEHTFADVFGGSSSASRRQIERCLEEIGRRGSGVLVYLRQTSSGELQHQVDTAAPRSSERPRALMREYGLGAQILRDLGVRKIELLTGSTKDLVGLDAFGIEIVSQRPLPPLQTPSNQPKQPL